MIGIGVDAVELDRFRRVIDRTPSLVTRVFTPGERSDADKRGDPAPRLAGGWAAKEAAMKALGVGIGGLDFHDVEVVRADSGAPSLVVTGRAAALAADQGVSSWLVSITHTERTAVAVVAAL